MIPTKTPEVISRIKKIRRELIKIKKMYKTHHRKWRIYKRVSTCFKVSINTLNAITISSLVISFTGSFPILILTITSSTISSILSVIHDTVGFPEKYMNHQTSFLQLLDLHSTYNNLLLGDTPNYTSILNEINAKLGLILDSANVVSVSSSFEEHDVA